MTGLDPGRHVIVEIATLITDDDLNIIAEGPDLVVHQDEAALAEMDPVVVEMHTQQRPARRDPSIHARRWTMPARRHWSSSRPHVTEERRVPLCGNSIGMDRRFLAAYLPDIEEYLHYRSVDVSTIKELVKRWYPGAQRQSATQDRLASSARRHPREHRRDDVLPRARVRARQRRAGCACRPCHGAFARIQLSALAGGTRFSSMSASSDRRRESSFEGLTPKRSGLDSVTVVQTRQARGCMGVKCLPGIGAASKPHNVSRRRPSGLTLVRKA